MGIWSASDTPYDARLPYLEWRRTESANDELREEVRISYRSRVLTNLPGIHPLMAWRAYNDGAGVEQRIQEIAQLGVGRTAMDDLGYNALLRQVAGFAFPLLHLIRSTALQVTWRNAQPSRLRTEPVRRLLLRASRTIGELRGPPRSRVAA